MFDGLINGDIRRMKGLLLYFNKRIVLLIFLVMQMETFAQRGRFIPQDWGGDSYNSHSSPLSDLWIILLVAAVLLVLYIRARIQLFNKNNNNGVSKGANNSSTNSNTDKQKSSYETLDTLLRKNRDATSYHEYEKESWIMSTKKLLHEEERELSDFSDSFRYNYYDLSTYPKFGIEPSQAIKHIKTRAISIPQSIEPFDSSVLDKFEIVIVPSINDLKFKKLLLNYNGVVIEASFEGITWIGKEMSISAFCKLYGDLQPKSIDSVPFFLAKDGKRVYFSQELLDSFNMAIKNKEKFKLDLDKLKVREYFSMKDKKFYFRAYYNYKGKE